MDGLTAFRRAGASGAAPLVLEKLDDAVLEIFCLVREAVVEATDIFLHADRTRVRSLMEREALIDELHRTTEDAARSELLRPVNVNVERREHLLLIVGILPE